MSRGMAETDEECLRSGTMFSALYIFRPKSLLSFLVSERRLTGWAGKDVWGGRLVNAMGCHFELGLQNCASSVEKLTPHEERGAVSSLL